MNKFIKHLDISGLKINFEHMVMVPEAREAPCLEWLNISHTDLKGQK